MNIKKVVLTGALLTLSACQSTGMGFDTSSPQVPRQDTRELTQQLYEINPENQRSESVLVDFQEGIKTQDSFAFSQIILEALDEQLEEHKLILPSDDIQITYRVSTSSEYINNVYQTCQNFVFYKESGLPEDMRIQQVVEGSACQSPLNSAWFIIR